MYMNESAWRILRADVAGRNDIGRRDKSLIIVAFLLGYGMLAWVSSTR